MPIAADLAEAVTALLDGPLAVLAALARAGHLLGRPRTRPRTADLFAQSITFCN